MKRHYRNDMSMSQKNAISKALMGRKLTEEHRKRITEGLQKYWSELPQKPQQIENNGTTTEVPNEK